MRIWKWTDLGHCKIDLVEFYDDSLEEFFPSGFVENFTDYLLGQNQVSTSNYKRDIRKIQWGSFILPHPLVLDYCSAKQKRQEWNEYERETCFLYDYTRESNDKQNEDGINKTAQIRTNILYIVFRK